MRSIGPAHAQSGVAALTMALLLMLFAAVVTVGATQVGVFEQKAMGAEVRHQDALANAEMALDSAEMYLQQNRTLATSTATGGWASTGSMKWSVCSSSDTSIPCGDGKGNNLFDNNWTAYADVPYTAVNANTGARSFKAHYVAHAATAGAAAPAPSSVFYIVGEGTSTPTSAAPSGESGVRSVVRRSVSFHSALAGNPAAPIVAAGTVGLNGTINVVTNPNGGGPGVPLSVWSDADVTESGSVQTCHVQEYLDNPGGNASTAYTTVTNSDIGATEVLCPTCTCPSSSDYTLSSAAIGDGIDVLDRDSGSGVNPDTTNFPSDLFQYIFGVPSSDYLGIKNQSTVLSDCSSLGPSSKGLIWVTGDCSIPSNTTVGSYQYPVLLVIEDSGFTMNANSQFFGLVFIFTHAVAPSSINVQLNGGPILYGAIVANSQVNLGNGSYTARYDQNVLSALKNDTPLLAEIPGSWRDY